MEEGGQGKDDEFFFMSIYSYIYLVVLIQASGRISHYVRYATEILTGQQDGESEGTFLTIKALGKAINRAITVAEILKSQVQDIHQVLYFLLFCLVFGVAQCSIYFTNACVRVC